MNKIILVILFSLCFFSSCARTREMSVRSDFFVIRSDADIQEAIALAKKAHRRGRNILVFINPQSERFSLDDHYLSSGYPWALERIASEIKKPK